MALNIVLIEPEIPQNTGNIARLCACCGASLYLVGKLGFSLSSKYTKHPLGFDISQKAVKRAGLDYWDKLEIVEYENLEDFKNKVDTNDIYLLSTKANKVYTDVKYTGDSYLVFGPETRGIPEDYILEKFDKTVRIPMRKKIRSLNLSNSVAIVAYEAQRQINYEGLQEKSTYFDDL